MWRTAMRLAAALQSHPHASGATPRISSRLFSSHQVGHFDAPWKPRDASPAQRRFLAAAALPMPAFEDEELDLIIEPNPSINLSLQTKLNLGYACDNLTLRRSDRIFTNRACQKRTFESLGLDHVSKLALQNCKDLAKIIQWNHENNIHLFRVSSKLFPWSGQYELEALPDFEEIAGALAAAGELARKYGQRLTNHPPHFIKLASLDEELRKRSIADLEIQARVFDLMGFSPSHWNKINIHIGGNYGSKTKTIDRFARTFDTLSNSVKHRLAVENDDRPQSYSVADLLRLHSLTAIPITFDFHHHQFCTGGQTQQEAFEAALTTWPKDVRPVVHWSETPECPTRQRTHPHAHSAFVYGPMNLYGREMEVDVMIESKAKEVALLMYRDEIVPRLLLG